MNKGLNIQMGILEYEMYQDIPSRESGSTNLFNGIPYDVFKTYLETQNFQHLMQFCHSCAS